MTAIPRRAARMLGISLALGCSLGAGAQARILRLSIDSAFTKRPMPFMVCLPEGYGGGERYPVWYGLHGSGGSEMMWIDAVGAPAKADALAAAGEVKGLVMVFPYTRNDSIKEVRESMGEDGGFGERNMDRFLCEELIPYIDARFDTDPSAEGRSIGGFSMGGAIALRIAFCHPELFGRAGGFSAAVPVSDFTGDRLESWLYPGLEAPAAAKDLSGLRVYLDAGARGDPFFEGLRSLDECLRSRGVRSEFHAFDGGHDLAHMEADFREYLLFFTS